MTAAPLSIEEQAMVNGLERMLTWAWRINPGRGMSATAFTTLDTLAFGGPLRISELADREGITQPGMTGLINRLEADGLATRAPDPTDGRAALVTITQAGIALLAARRADRASAIARRIGELEPADHVLLVAALPAIDRLTAGLTAVPA